MDLFRIGRLPYMARRNYLVEIQHLFIWGLFAGLVEGTVSAVVVSKTFGGSIFLITVVQATPAFANLVSLVWGALIVGRRKMPVFMALAAASVSCALTVSMTPDTEMGGWIFALQICLARVFMSGVVTTRASLWKSNYPKSHRGRITAGLQIVRTLVSLPIILGCGALFDFNHLAYEWFYPVVALTGALGLIIFRRLHVRGEKLAISTRAGGDQDAIAEAGLVAPFSLVSLVTPWQIVGRMREALRQDPRFARYCTAQMCLGSANLMAMPVNTIVLTKVLGLSYLVSNGFLDGLPRVVTLIMLPIWARHFDRVGVLRFRVANSICWCASLFFCGLGAMAAAHYGGGAMIALTLAIAAYCVGRIADGMAQSGGAIAWNIGHLHFAEGDKAELYMGIHVSLTGFRGLIAPFFGAFLYQWIGWGAFGVALIISVTGLVLFAQLASEERKDRKKARPAGEMGQETITRPGTATVSHRET